MNIRIVVGGDICPMGKVETLFIKGAAQEIYNDLAEEIKNANFSIANLECPLIVKESPIKKAGPVLGADVECINGIKAGGWSLINLANNHSFDHGTNGLNSTIHALESANIPYVGAGKTLEDAQKPFTTSINGHKIVICSMAEQEFSVATDDTPGSNPLDLINFVNTIKKYKDDSFFLVLVHGGAEYYDFPTPETVRRFHFMIEMGADAIVCCHSHCPQPWEIYKGKPIIYGLGNLIFEADREEPEKWYEGYLAELIITQDKINFKPIPYIQSASICGTQKMTGTVLDGFFKKMNNNSLQMKSEGFIDKEWIEYCKKKKGIHLPILFGDNRFKRKLGKYIFSKMHPLQAILQSLLLVRCETHREILNTILSIENSNVNKREQAK